MSAFVPGGSYTKTSNNIKSTLYCNSKKRDQASIPAGMDLTSLSQANIENLDGFLVNNPGNGGSNGYVPGGSYTITSSGEVVILSANCQKRDQSWQYSTLDITHLPVGKTLSNIDGVLTVD
ncbi:cyanovirin [Mucilaginibacter agri]|uniref:Cyanovirin n=1 Tax=Mucilaginibacter agri TaxID=2695265 RepID=A0A966DT35_9SPHI|nr:cyanovirin [Mucilaginibacter agri]NCD68902.1 cyanovirin [Mucilaginibacter agri]